MREFRIEIDAGVPDRPLDAFVCHPEEGGPFPPVILYMDAPGMREELRDMARRLGTAGYFVVLPNLYYRTGREGAYGFDLAGTRADGPDRRKMFEVMNTLTNARVVADTGPLLEFAKNAEAASGRVGCVGYCMSGQFVVSVAAAWPREIVAVASFYGVGIVTDKDDSPHLRAADISAELYLGFAADDPYVPQSVLDRLPGILAEAGVEHRIEVYPDTEHGFAFPKRRGVYRKAAGERHWERIFALFARRLAA